MSNEDESKPDSEEPQDHSGPEPESEFPGLNVDPDVLAQAVADGQAAEQTGNRLDAARAGILAGQIRQYQSALATIGYAVNAHHDQNRNRQMSSLSSRDTAYYEGKGDEALQLLELLANLGVPIPMEGP